MKILALVGSYRKNGNTDQVVQQIVGHLQALAQEQHVALEIETLSLGQQEIGVCRGCRVCFDRGEEKCPVKDNLLAIKAKMKQADGLLIASPVYVDDVSGIVKTWIDRLAHVCHRPEFAGKCAYLVTTVGSSPTSHALRTLSLALSTWGFHIVGQAGFKTGALMKPGEMPDRDVKKTERIAQRFFQALQKREYARPSFLSLMMFRIQQLARQRAPQGTVDAQYWNRHGWTDPRTDFYIDHEANRVKVALARLTGAVIAKFVS